MSADPRLTHLPSAEHAPVDLRWMVDVVVLNDAERFLAELGHLTNQMELVVDRLAEIIIAQAGPGGADPAMRAWVIHLLVRSGTAPRPADLWRWSPALCTTYRRTSRPASTRPWAEASSPAGRPGSCSR